MNSDTISALADAGGIGLAIIMAGLVIYLVRSGISSQRELMERHDKEHNSFIAALSENNKSINKNSEVLDRLSTMQDNHMKHIEGSLAASQQAIQSLEKLVDHFISFGIRRGDQ